MEGTEGEVEILKQFSLLVADFCLPDVAILREFGGLSL